MRARNILSVFFQVKISQLFPFIWKGDSVKHFVYAYTYPFFVQ